MERKHVSESEDGDEKTGLNSTAHDAEDERIGFAEASTGAPEGPAEGNCDKTLHERAQMSTD